MMFMKYRFSRAYWRVIHAEALHNQSFTMESHRNLCKEKAILHYLASRLGLMDSKRVQAALFGDDK